MSPSATLHCVKSNNERNGRNVFAKVAMGSFSPVPHRDLCVFLCVHCVHCVHCVRL
jgi:hypothetical protein